MNCSLTSSPEEKEEEEEDYLIHQYLTLRKMFSRVMNKVRSPDRVPGINHKQARGQEESHECRKLNTVESFYENLGYGLRNLESSLSIGNDAVSIFQVEWLVLAVSFLHSVHLETFALVETVWLPAKSMLGPESLSDYLDVSMSLLDTCNNLKEALNQLETSQMSMDLILRRLMSLLQNMDHTADHQVPDSSCYLKPLTECEKELDRLDATNDCYHMWVELVPNYALGEKILKANSLARTYSVVPLPATQVKKKSREVSIVLYDVQVVTSFVACTLLWIITGQAGDMQSPTHVKLDLLTIPDVKDQILCSSTSPWPTFLFRLKDKVEKSVEYVRKSNSNSFSKLQDVINLRSSLKALSTELEGGFREGKFAGPGTEFTEKIKNLLEQKKQKLAELTKSLERISAQLNEMFTEIIDRRKKVLDIYESRPLYHAFSI